MRRQRSLRIPHGIQLWLAIQFSAVVAPAVAAIRSGMTAYTEDIGVTADAAGSESYKKWLSGIKAQAKARAKQKVPPASVEAGKREKKWSQDEFARLGIELRTAEPSLASIIDDFRRENVERITGMLDDQFDKVEKILSEGEGRRAESLQKDIERQLDITSSRAALIARDQVLTLNAQVNATRCAAAGITRYVWTTVGDERVRGDPDGKWPNGMHFELDGQEFAFDDPPVTNEDGDENNPGEDYQCRCTAYPILDELEEEAA